MKTPSDSGEPPKPAASAYRKPWGDDPEPTGRVPVRAAMLTSILFGVVMLPLGLWATWSGAAALHADLGRQITAGLAAGVFAPCAGVVIASVAFMRLLACLSLLRRDARATARAHAAARVSFWGDVALLLGLLLTLGPYSLTVVLFISPYVIPSILQSIALEDAAGRLDASRMTPPGKG